MKRKATKISFEETHFLVAQSPVTDSIDGFLETLEKYHVKTVVRCTESKTYDAEQIEKQGIEHVELPFGENGMLSRQNVEEWIGLVDMAFNKDLKALEEKAKIGDSQADEISAYASVEACTSRKEVTERIAVHCGSGITNAPVLVVLGFII